MKLMKYIFYVYFWFICLMLLCALFCGGCCEHDTDVYNNTVDLWCTRHGDVVIVDFESSGLLRINGGPPQHVMAFDSPMRTEVCGKAVIELETALGNSVTCEVLEAE